MTRLVLISDTHMHLPVLPKGDVLIHAGDMTFRGTPAETGRFMTWLASVRENFHRVIIVAGNHELGWEKGMPKIADELARMNVDFLNDSGVSFAGLSFWGSPVQPEFCNWAFNRRRGAEIKRHWDEIPAGVDVLITHGPPFGMLDRTVDGRLVGCEELAEAIKRTKPRLHVFGHIHEGYGTLETAGTTFVNASIMNEAYRPVNRPVVVELTAGESTPAVIVTSSTL